MADLAFEMNRASSPVSRAPHATGIPPPDKPRFVAGALGPRPRRPASPRRERPRCRNIDFETLRRAYYEQTQALVEGGADVLLVETIFDTLNAKAALFAIDEFLRPAASACPS